MLLEIRQVNIAGIDFNEAIMHLAVLKLAKKEYEEMKLPAPDWVVEKLEALAREVNDRHRDYLESKLREVNRERNALRSREEKKAALDAEAEELRKALNK